MVNIGINGFGRIGRLVMRAMLNEPGLNVVAINGSASTDPKTRAHLLKYDSVHGTFANEVEAGDDYIKVDGKTIAVTNKMQPNEIPWQEHDVDIVIEASGLFMDGLTANGHMESGVKKVLLTAPGKNEDATLVYGVNHENYQPDKHHIISNASCTTNCLAPVANVINKNFTIKRGLMTTVHAYTNDQNILDASHKDLRRARAGAMSIIPTTTGAAKAVATVLPELEGKLNGFALRVPTPNVSLVDLVLELEKNATAEEVNKALENAANNELKGILAYSELPLVSIDFNGDSHSASVDGLSTMAMGDNMVKVISWYDNEWGYSCRIVDFAKYMIKQGL